MIDKTNLEAELERHKRLYHEQGKLYRRAQADIEDLQNELLLAKALNNQLKGELETLKKLLWDIDEADMFQHDSACEIWYKSEGVHCNCGLFELQTRLYMATENLL
jgi:hypothetical protein